MQDNWYEAVMSRQAPHRILSVVDWASDSPVPNEPAQRSPATYNVFPFGINDPSEGNRSHNKEIFDPLASPLGWHVIPVANDPLSSDLKKKDGFSNYTTTFGNNVGISVVLLQRRYLFVHRCLLTRIGRARLAGSTITGLMAANS
jgi:extracellular elastinolytic metalloproteinase